MRFLTLVGAAAALFGAVHAESGFFDPPIFPRECAIPCGPLVTYAQNQCLGDENSCLCDQKNTDKLIPRCEACSYNQKNSKNGQTFYPQIKSLVGICNLKTTSVTLGAAAPTAMPMLGAGAAALMAGYAAM